MNLFQTILLLRDSPRQLQPSAARAQLSMAGLPVSEQACEMSVTVCDAARQQVLTLTDNVSRNSIQPSSQCRLAWFGAEAFARNKGTS